MKNENKQPAKILPFSPKPLFNLGYERVKRKKRGEPGKEGQLNLFSGALGRILHLPSSMSLFDEALLLDEHGKEEMASAVYWKAIANEDSVADAYCNLGILESRAGRNTKAFDCFTLALKHDPRHPESHYNLGNLYFEMGDFKLAGVHYEMSAGMDPNFPNVHFNLGLIHAINSDFTAAANAFNRYIELVSPAEGTKARELLAQLTESLRVQKRT